MAELEKRAVASASLSSIHPFYMLALLLALVRQGKFIILALASRKFPDKKTSSRSRRLDLEMMHYIFSLADLRWQTRFFRCGRSAKT